MNLKLWTFRSEVSTSGLQTPLGLQWAARRVYEHLRNITSSQIVATISWPLQTSQKNLLQGRRPNFLLPFSIIQRRRPYPICYGWLSP